MSLINNLVTNSASQNGDFLVIGMGIIVGGMGILGFVLLSQYLSPKPLQKPLHKDQGVQTEGLEEADISDSLSDTSSDTIISPLSTRFSNNSSVIPTTSSADIPTTSSADIPTTSEAVIPTTSEAVIPTTSSANIPTTSEAVIPTTSSADIPTTSSADIQNTTDIANLADVAEVVEANI
jgi:hypothetical protein